MVAYLLALGAVERNTSIIAVVLIIEVVGGLRGAEGAVLTSGALRMPTGFKVCERAVEVFHFVIVQPHFIDEVHDARHLAANMVNLVRSIIAVEANTEQAADFVLTIHTEKLLDFCLRFCKPIFCGSTKRGAESLARIDIGVEVHGNVIRTISQTVLFEGVPANRLAYDIIEIIDFIGKGGRIGTPLAEQGKGIFPFGHSMDFPPLRVENAVYSENFDGNRNIGKADNAVDILAIAKIAMISSGIDKGIANTSVYLLRGIGQLPARYTDNTERGFKICDNVLASIEVDSVGVAVTSDVNDGVH